MRYTDKGEEILSLVLPWLEYLGETLLMYSTKFVNLMGYELFTNKSNNNSKNVVMTRIPLLLQLLIHESTG